MKQNCIHNFFPLCTFHIHFFPVMVTEIFLTNFTDMISCLLSPLCSSPATAEGNRRYPLMQGLTFSTTYLLFPSPGCMGVFKATRKYRREEIPPALFLLTAHFFLYNSLLHMLKKYLPQGYSFIDSYQWILDHWVWEEVTKQLNILQQTAYS